MTALLWRILIAVVVVLVVFALIPPLFRILGFDASGDLLIIFRICIGGLALLYVLKGPPAFPST